jgi:hypothetical protein
VDAFAAAAEQGFGRRGPGVVLLVVSGLAGGDNFQPQDQILLRYVPKSKIVNSDPPDDVTIQVLGRCIFPEQAVIVAKYEDGEIDVGRFPILEMRKKFGGREGVAQYIAADDPAN